MSDEVPLSGGRMTHGVFKKGNYVFRPCCSNSGFVHKVLKWLDMKGVAVAPKFIGLSDDGREVTTFLEGIAPGNLGTYNGNNHWIPTDNQFCEAGKIIKTLHTALWDFPGCFNGQTVCHNDLSPCNFMFKNDIPYAVFDWDAAEINDPLNDIAYAAWMWSDIGNDEHSPIAQGNRIKVILDAYGLERKHRGLLIDKMHEQIQRVEESLFTANLIPNSQWANEVDQRLYKYQKQIEPCLF
jgi:hypothetical protein